MSFAKGKRKISNSVRKNNKLREQRKNIAANEFRARTTNENILPVQKIKRRWPSTNHE